MVGQSQSWRPLLIMSATRPLISVTLPNYNYGRFLAEAFESVLTQTYEELEILFVDDGSTDDSAAIARDYAGRDSRIKPVYFEKNRGALPAHENTWSRASGELVYQFSSDDAVNDRDFFRLAVEALRMWPNAGGFFGPAAMISTETGALLGYMGKSSPEGYISPAPFLNGFLHYRIFVPGISSIWRRRAIDDVGGYDYNLGPQADYFINHAIPARQGVVYAERAFARARISESKKSYSSNTSLTEEMKRLATFEKKMRHLTAKLGNNDPSWRVWRDGQAKQLLQKHGTAAVATMAQTQTGRDSAAN
jgi:glycosyltransferase involved in cell wall biosynthesis